MPVAKIDFNFDFGINPLFHLKYVIQVAIAWPGILLMNVAAATTLFIVSFKKQIFSSVSFSFCLQEK